MFILTTLIQGEQLHNSLLTFSIYVTLQETKSENNVMYVTLISFKFENGNIVLQKRKFHIMYTGGQYQNSYVFR